MIANSADLSNQKRRNLQVIKAKTHKRILLIKFFHIYTPAKVYQLLANFSEEIRKKSINFTLL